MFLSFFLSHLQNTVLCWSAILKPFFAPLSLTLLTLQSTGESFLEEALLFWLQTDTDTKEKGRISLAPKRPPSPSQLRSGELVMGSLIPLPLSPLSKKQAFFLPLVSFHAVASIIASAQGLHASGHAQNDVRVRQAGWCEPDSCHGIPSLPSFQFPKFLIICHPTPTLWRRVFARGSRRKCFSRTFSPT